MNLLKKSYLAIGATFLLVIFFHFPSPFTMSMVWKVNRIMSWVDEYDIHEFDLRSGECEVLFMLHNRYRISMQGCTLGKMYTRKVGEQLRIYTRQRHILLATKVLNMCLFSQFHTPQAGAWPWIYTRQR